MSLRTPINDETKIMIILLVGIAASLAVISVIGMPHDQACREIHDYSRQAVEEFSSYDPDPEKQLDVFKEEFGDSWVSGHYDEKTDSLHVCKKTQ